MIFVLVILIVPMLQMYFAIYEEDSKLQMPASPKVSFSLDGWLNGTYQAQQDAWNADNFGFRNSFLRANNEFKYRVFEKTKSYETVFGKNSMLYADAYITTYLAKDWFRTTEEKIKERIEKLKFVQDTLIKLNKFAYFIIAPNKVRVLSENIPDEYADIPYKKTIYDITVKYLKQYGVKYIDFNEVFLNMKKKVPYQFLFPKYGLHWSQASCLYAADTMLRHIEHIQHLSLPGFKIEETIVGDSISLVDSDIANSMSLYTQKLPTPPMIYYKTSIVNKNNTATALIIGDSFYFNLIYNGFHNMFDKSSFLYYFKNVYPYDDQSLFLNLDLKQEFNKSDFVLFITTEMNLYKAGFGGIEYYYNLLKFGEDAAFNRGIQIKLMEMKIRSNSEWFAGVCSRAGGRGITVDSSVTLEAVYTLQETGRIK
ncbi:MAG: sugar O-acetyltransferase precursor [Bacteroidetes bacterium]|nr:sugar O-acetyltransferase precursor [Bacteroidota bacterium]